MGSSAIRRGFEYAATRDTGLARTTGSLRRGAQDIGRWPEPPSIALDMELEITLPAGDLYDDQFFVALRDVKDLLTIR